MRESAYHEAAHAVVAILSKIQIGDLTIVADDISTGSTYIDPIPEDASAELKWAYSRVYLAGVLAELRMEDSEALACAPDEILQKMASSPRLLRAFAPDFSKIEKITLEEIRRRRQPEPAERNRTHR
jgi:hypothetical protein